jgi:hypothetical protein
VFAALATRHNKDAIFRPRLASLGYDVVVADVDTDAFGTFTGEIERNGTPYDTLVAKARAAIRATGASVGLASEGSFGPSPASPFITVDHELVALVDQLDQIVIVAEAAAIAQVPAAHTLDAATTEIPGHLLAGLPAQALITRPFDFPDRRGLGITKAIVSEAQLHESIARARAMSRDGRVRVEPDLRAHHCPSRRKVIAAAVDNLVLRLSSRCPACASIGFGLVATVPGLSCSECGCPTSRVRAEIFGCPRCAHRETRTLEGQADPGECPMCNP